MFNKVIISLLTLGIFLAQSPTSAEEYNIHIADIDQCNNFGIDAANLGNADVHVDYIDFTYDDVTKLLTAEVVVDNSRGGLADLFHFVLTDGGMPGGEGAAAHIYFDATDINDPKVNVYVYNGNGNNFCGNYERDNNGNLVLDGGNPIQIGSWTKGNDSNTWDLAEDRILTSESSVDATGSVTSFTPTNGGTVGRVYNLTIDTSNINTHNPEIFNHGTHSYSYDGIQFGENVGIWFWAADDADTSFDGNGFLSNFDADTCAICDQANFETKQEPVCSGSSATTNPVEVGESTKITINITDPDCNDADAVPVLVSSYTNLPAGAVADVKVGQAVTFDASCNGSVTISWTPTDGQEGTHTITANFTKDYGQTTYTANCGSVLVQVDPLTPECKQSDIGVITQADQNLGRLAHLATSLKRSVSRLRKKVGNRNPVDNASAAELNKTGWMAFNNIVSEGTYLFECTNAQACNGGLQVTSLSGDVATFDSALSELTDLANTRAKKFRKAFRIFLMEKKGLSKKAATRKAKNRTNNKWLIGKNNDGVTPVSANADTQLDLHVATYGTNRFVCPNANIVN